MQTESDNEPLVMGAGLTLTLCGGADEELGRDEESARCLATWDNSFDPAGRSVPQVVDDLLELQPRDQDWNLAYVSVAKGAEKLLADMPTATDGRVKHGVHMWREAEFHPVTKKQRATRVYFRLK